MPKELEPGTKIKRIIPVFSVGLCEATIDSEGVAIRIPGSRSYVIAPWLRIVEKAGLTPDNVACYLSGDPVKMLLAEKAKVEKNRAKREAKKEKQ